MVRLIDNAQHTSTGPVVSIVSMEHVSAFCTYVKWDTDLSHVRMLSWKCPCLQGIQIFSSLATFNIIEHPITSRDIQPNEAWKGLEMKMFLPICVADTSNHFLDALIVLDNVRLHHRDSGTSS